MSKIHALMEVGKKSLINSQIGLQTVAHNVANRTQEGYSRQRVEIETSPAVNQGRYQIGMGAFVKTVNRIVNPLIDRQIATTKSHHAFHESRAFFFNRLENLINEAQNSGLSQQVSELFNAFRELAVTPESVTARALVKEKAISLSQKANQFFNAIRDINNDINNQVQVTVTEVNNIVGQIAELNQRIQENRIKGINPNDLLDKRDVLIKQLSELMDIRVAESDQGIVTVMGPGNVILVSGNQSHELNSYVDSEGRFHVFYQQGSKNVDVTDRLSDGRLGGLKSAQESGLERLLSGVSQWLKVLGQEINEVHRQGYDLNGQKGLEFFKVKTHTDGSVEVELNPEILNDLSRIAVAGNPDGVADATVAHMISQLENRPIFNDGKATLADFYNSLLGEVGVMSQRAQEDVSIQKELMTQLEKVRESVSGVNLDEETTQMLEWQKTFEASARLIRVADEMLETVLNLRPL